MDNPYIIKYTRQKRSSGMKKLKGNTSVKVIIVNPPTKEQADKRIKELASYLEQIWKNLRNID